MFEVNKGKCVTFLQINVWANCVFLSLKKNCLDYVIEMLHYVIAFRVSQLDSDCYLFIFP